MVHAPELFAGDHTLDLCSADEVYRRHSLKNSSVVDISVTCAVVSTAPIPSIW